MSTSTTIPSAGDVEGYNTDQLITYLQSYFQKYGVTLSNSDIQKFREGDINGRTFFTLTADLLMQFGFSMGKSAILVGLINNLNNQSKFYHKIV